MTTDERIIELLEEILDKLDYMNKTLDNCEAQLLNIECDTSRIGDN